MTNYFPVKLIEYVRDGLVEQEHLGFIVRIDEDGKINKLGEDNDYPFYLRSCAKPLQASLLIDYELDEFYNMTDEEIAICCASHTGEPCHTQIVKTLLDKIGLDESYFKCGLHKPISKIEQNKLLILGEDENVFQNNCSGKHVMMLGLCKKMGWCVNDYDTAEHPLQIAIKKKIYDLCELQNYSSSPPAGEDRGEGVQSHGVDVYPLTKDGCGVPIMSMPLANMVKGYLNLFLDDKYMKLRQAFSKNPYLIGGADRLDTAIMNSNPGLLAKVGAGGLCVVINLELKEGMIVKIMDCDMKARAVCLIEALSQLGWLNDIMLDNPLMQAQNKRDIKTLHGEKIGTRKFLFDL